jgi:hypothetical protein
VQASWAWPCAWPMFPCCASQRLHVRAACPDAEEAYQLQSCVDGWGLDNIQLDVEAVSDGYGW